MLLFMCNRLLGRAVQENVSKLKEEGNGESAKIMFHAPYRYLNRYDISCSTRRETRGLQSFFMSVLGRIDGGFCTKEP